MISKEQYIEWRKAIDVYDAAAKRQYGQPDGSIFIPGGATDLPYKPSNEMRSAVECYDWMVAPPAKYFAYVKEQSKEEREKAGFVGAPLFSRGELTTWMGDKLGYIYGGKPFKDNFGGERVSIDVVGTNGVLYYGTYYRSSGDYCRIKMYKNQAAAAKRLNGPEWILLGSLKLEL